MGEDEVEVVMVVVEIHPGVRSGRTGSLGVHGVGSTTNHKALKAFVPIRLFSHSFLPPPLSSSPVSPNPVKSPGSE